MNKKYIAVVLLFSGLFIFSTLLSYAFNIYRQIYVGDQEEGKPFIVEADATPTPTPDPLGPKNILLLGYGGAGHEGGLLTDTIIVAHIVPRQNQVFLISIPRDIALPLPIKKDGEENLKVNHAYAIGSDNINYKNKPDEFSGEAGGGNLAKYALKQITGLDMDYFISVNFDGFKNIITNLGGVSVYIPYTFDDKFYPVKGLENETCGKSEEDIAALTATLSANLLEREFQCRYETLHFDKGQQLLDAEAALKFVRSRHSEINGGDFGRSQRQQALLIAIKNKLISYKSITKIIPIVNSIAKNLRTDINFTEAFDLAKDQGDFTDIKIETISLSTDNVLSEAYGVGGQYVLIPRNGENKWEVIHEFIRENLQR